jgi:exopolysaccharide biosynthesis protein
MRYYFFQFALFLIPFFSIPYSLNAQNTAQHLRLKHFQKENLAPGLQWYQVQTTDYLGSPQSINILAIRTRKRAIDLLYQPDTLIRTADYATSVKAIAAVNAGFFNVLQGGSVTYVKKDGQVLAQNQADLRQRNSVVLRGAFVVSDRGRIAIETPKSTDSYTRDTRIDDVLLSGPLLIEASKKVPLDSTAFILDRHPRTCACLTAKNRLLLLTADGRHTEAAGLSLPELTDLLLALKCKSAINLDGGGSTTMYIREQSAHGIVNYPSDNRIFDHRGQRKVANVIVVH